jgi:hypothetical protein
MNSEQNCDTGDDLDDINSQLDGLSLTAENEIDLQHISPQIQFLRDLSPKKLQPILLTFLSAYVLESMLSKRSYLPLQIRKYLLLFTSTILLNENPDQEILSSQFNKRPKELKYIPKVYCDRMLFYFILWKDLILQISYQKINDYLCNNRELTPKFYEVISQISYINEIAKSYETKYTAKIGGTKPEATFYSDLRNICPGLESQIIYHQQIRSDDCDLKSGDLVSETHSIDVPMLPRA